MQRQILFAFFLLCTTVLTAQTTKPTIAKRSYTTQVVAEQESPQIDGLLDDPAWNETEWAGDFVEWRPDENTSPTFASRFK